VLCDVTLLLLILMYLILDVIIIIICTFMQRHICLEGYGGAVCLLIGHKLVHATKALLTLCEIFSLNSE